MDKESARKEFLTIYKNPLVLSTDYKPTHSAKHFFWKKFTDDILRVKIDNNSFFIEYHGVILPIQEDNT